MIKKIKDTKSKLIGNKGEKYTNSQLVTRSAMWFLFTIFVLTIIFTLLINYPIPTVATLIILALLAIAIFILAFGYVLIQEFIQKLNERAIMRSDK